MSFDKNIYIKRNSKVGVLMLHSFTSTPQEFMDMANFLASKNFTIYAPVIAGHGTSPADLAKTTIGQWQKSVEEAYIKLYQEVDKVYIIGSSFGGNLAFDLAAKFSDSIAGIISLATPIKLRRNILRKILLYSYGYFIKYQKKITGDYPFFPPNKKNIYYPTMPIVSIKRFYEFINRHTLPNLKNVIAPTLIVQAIADRTVNPVSANFLLSSIGSQQKNIMWVNGNDHVLALGNSRGLMYKEVYKFINN